MIEVGGVLLSSFCHKNLNIKRINYPTNLIFNYTNIKIKKFFCIK